MERPEEGRLLDQIEFDNAGGPIAAFARSNNVYKGGCKYIFEEGSKELKDPRGRTERKRITREVHHMSSTKCAGMNTWPSSSPFRCWNCSDFFSGPPMKVPESCDPVLGIYQVFGNFCTVGCAGRWILDNPTWSSPARLGWLLSIAVDVYPDVLKDGRMPIAPSRYERVDFGGDMSIEEYQLLKNNPDVLVSTEFPPISAAATSVTDTFYGEDEGGKNEKRVVEDTQKALDAMKKCPKCERSRKKQAFNLDLKKCMEYASDLNRKTSLHEVLGQVEEVTPEARRYLALQSADDRVDFTNVSRPGDTAVKRRQAARPRRRPQVGAFARYCLTNKIEMHDPEVHGGDTSIAPAIRDVDSHATTLMDMARNTLYQFSGDVRQE